MSLTLEERLNQHQGWLGAPTVSSSLEMTPCFSGYTPDIMDVWAGYVTVG